MCTGTLLQSKKATCLLVLDLKNIRKYLADVSTEFSSRHQGKSERGVNITIYSHTLLRIHLIGGQRSVRIAPPLPPHSLLIKEQ